MRVPTALVALACLTSCATGPRPVPPSAPRSGEPRECGPPPAHVFMGAVTAVDLMARVVELGEGGLSLERWPVVISTASEAYKQAEQRDYQRCLLMHRDGACHALVAYYERLWTFLVTSPSPDQMSVWQKSNSPPLCRK